MGFFFSKLNESKAQYGWNAFIRKNGFIFALMLSISLGLVIVESVQAHTTPPLIKSAVNCKVSQVSEEGVVLSDRLDWTWVKRINTKTPVQTLPLPLGGSIEVSQFNGHAAMPDFFEVAINSMDELAGMKLKSMIVNGHSLISMTSTQFSKLEIECTLRPF